MKAERTGNGRIGWEGRLFRYISLLLIVAVLFSGVTFARYASMSEGSLTTGIARFDPSFTVDGVNSFTFGNSNYWQNYNEQWLEQGKGSARTVRISLHNDGEVKAMPAVIHMEGPAEFWENVALQMTKANADGSAGDPYTTQLVIADLLRERDGGKAVNGETHNFTYGGYINWGESDSFSTGKSEGPVEPPVTSGIANYSDDFDQRGEREETLIMSGGIKTTGTVTAVGNGYTLRITASMKEEVEYSVGFQRRDEDANEALPALYLDCRKTVPYYSVDLILPDDATNILPDDATNPFVVAPNGTNGVLDTSKGLVLFFTWTNSVSGGDFNLGITRSGTTSGTVGNDQSVAGFTWTQLSKLAQNEDGKSRPMRSPSTERPSSAITTTTSACLLPTARPPSASTSGLTRTPTSPIATSPRSRKTRVCIRTTWCWKATFTNAPTMVKTKSPLRKPPSTASQKASTSTTSSTRRRIRIRRPTATTTTPSRPRRATRSPSASPSFRRANSPRAA